jgi:hypothetical protein
MDGKKCKRMIQQQPLVFRGRILKEMNKIPSYMYSVCSSCEACYNVVADNDTPCSSLFIPDRLVTRTDYMSHVYMT